MRGKIIAVFTVVVLLVGGLSFALTRYTLGDLSDNEGAPRALAAASAQLQVEGLVLERWLASQVLDPKVREPYNAGTPSARAEGATAVANRLRDAASSASELASLAPALVVMVDAKGVVLGRNGSPLMRGDDLGTLYPPLRAGLDKGLTGSDVWVNRSRNEQVLASWAPIRNAEGAVIGGAVVGTPLNDERLSITSDRTSGGMLVVAVRGGDGLDLVAKSTGTPADLVSAFGASPAKDGALQALSSGQVVDLGGLPGSYKASSVALAGYGDGRRAVLISAAAQQTSGTLGQLLWPALLVILLGVGLVVVAGHLLDQYISQPISELEDGLLAIMNGKTDRRFEIEHSELGGLVFRLNSLLNQLLGVQEDDTDEAGRSVRSPPTATDFQEALAVDERIAALSSGEVVDAKALREESDESYYSRIFDDYIAAKRSLGDPVDHITKEDFIGKIMASEREMAAKHGKPVRYKVEVSEKQVTLLAVPLT
jgi:hypothetical protein